jgi:hypothetical protein
VRCGWERGSCGSFTEREAILVKVVEVCLRVRYEKAERTTARQRA